MGIAEILKAAYAADPIPFALGIVAVLLLPIAFLFREGGVGGRFTIQLFGIAATVATVIKVVWGLALVQLGHEPYAPIGGTDALLLFGGVSAILVTAGEDLVAAFGAKGEKRSRVREWWNGLRSFVADSVVPRLQASLQTLVSEWPRVADWLPARMIGETKEARARREQIEQQTIDETESARRDRERKDSKGGDDADRPA